MDYQIPRCRVVPLPDHQVSFQINHQEQLRWHYGADYSRPFFYPLYGPSRTSLTRMGHPGTPTHDHHRSIWFAHHDVLGRDFWSENTPTYTRQQNWIAYQDGDDEARMAVKMGRYDGHDPAPLIQQELIAAVRTNELDETFLELQATFTPISETLELGKTNYAFLGVRVSAELSAYFGGGELTNSSGMVGEKQIFGQPADWVDYSGPVRNDLFEGITLFYHPGNLSAPVSWHVREDGWMCPSTFKESSLLLSRKEPLTLRYLLWAHAGKCQPERTAKINTEFASSQGLKVVPAKVPHTEFVIKRL